MSFLLIWLQHKIWMASQSPVEHWRYPRSNRECLARPWSLHSIATSCRRYFFPFIFRCQPFTKSNLRAREKFDTVCASWKSLCLFDFCSLRHSLLFHFSLFHFCDPLRITVSPVAAPLALLRSSRAPPKIRANNQINRITRRARVRAAVIRNKFFKNTANIATGTNRTRAKKINNEKKTA